ncbi:hypothetical protein AHF37_06513 [Paragonimus kellicotti]|nr:hypothetical protein AHF37_06513 [Paragonimus kellicotti]
MTRRLSMFRSRYAVAFGDPDGVEQPTNVIHHRSQKFHDFSEPVVISKALGLESEKSPDLDSLSPLQFREVLRRWPFLFPCCFDIFISDILSDLRKRSITSSIYKSGGRTDASPVALPQCLQVDRW